MPYNSIQNMKKHNYIFTYLYPLHIKKQVFKEILQLRIFLSVFQLLLPYLYP